MNRKDTGNLGENLAANSIKKRGYRILERNYRCKQGEIDIVAEKKESLVFIEVRTKKSNDFGIPEESVTSFKKEKLISAAFNYLTEHQKHSSIWRIDFIAVELDNKGKMKRIEIIENAIP
jgi:putative endonuclease